MKSGKGVRDHLRYDYLPARFAQKVEATRAQYSSGFYKNNLILRTAFVRAQKKMWAELSDRVDAGIPCIVVACDEGDYVVQVLSVPGKAGSFVEAVVRPDDELFPFFHEKVGMLNLAGPNEAIENLGENYGKAHYNVYINTEQHARICQPKAKE
jgi:hypothetical protein